MQSFGEGLMVSANNCVNARFGTPAFQFVRDAINRTTRTDRYVPEGMHKSFVSGCSTATSVAALEGQTAEAAIPDNGGKE